jgi:hypothetical protein
MPEKKPGRPLGRITKSNAQLRRLTARVAKMLRDGATKRDVKDYLQDRLGCSARTVEDYIARARACWPDVPPPRRRRSECLLFDPAICRYVVRP